MKPIYLTFGELISAIGKREFKVKYYLSKEYIPLEDYQELCRVYLDEYNINSGRVNIS